MMRRGSLHLPGAATAVTLHHLRHQRRSQGHWGDRGGGAQASTSPAVASGSWTVPRGRHDGRDVAAGSATSPTFWLSEVRYTAPAEIKRSYAQERALDKRSRFRARERLREDGVASNLFPVDTSGGPAGVPHLYVYEMYATRGARPPSTETANDATAAKPKPKPKRRGGGGRGKGAGAAAEAPAAEERRVPPLRCWRAIRRSLQRRYAHLPPLVQLDYNLYSTAPLPADALAIPADFYDLGWSRCELRPQGRVTYADLPPHRLQELVNKIVPWAVSASQDAGMDGYRVVRERTGKMVCTAHGISSGGLRIFKGVLVQAVFIDAAAAAASGNGSGGGATASSVPPLQQPRGAAAPPPVPEEGRLGLAELPQGEVEGPLRMRVESVVRCITYKGRKVESYYISDATGKFLASYWDPTRAPQALDAGRTYDVAHARIKEYPSRGNLRLFEFTEGTTVFTAVTTPAAAADEGGTGEVGTATALPPHQQQQQQQHAPADAPSAGGGGFGGQLGLKIDAKGTIASETSLWEDVRQHFGPGPYDEDTQRRIAASVQGTAVVSSFNMRQSLVRMVRFDAGGAMEEVAAAKRARSTASGRKRGKRGGKDAEEEEDAEDAEDAEDGATAGTASQPALLTPRTMVEGLLPLLPQLDPHQPWAVMSDYSALPLQVLHCCFDPSMKGWQELAVSSLSLMPEKRVALLRVFQRALAVGLSKWGLTLAAEPWRTKAVSLLPAPLKEAGRGTAGGGGQHRGQLRHPPPSPFPTTLLILGIAGPRSTAEEANRVSLTAQQMAAYFKTNLVACVGSEADAVRAITEQLLVPTTTGGGGEQRLRDPNAGVVVVTPDRESRAVRWLMAECLCRGVLPLLMPPAASPRKVNLLCANTRRQLLGKYETNPLRGIDLGRNVPVLAGRRVLVVGVDSCHTNVTSTGAVVGVLYAPQRNHLLPVFWRHEARGREAQHVGDHFRTILAQAAALYDGLDEVVIFQDGDTFSELSAMRAEIAAAVPGCGLTFMCLHKRSNIRFVHDDATAGRHNNVVKGSVIPALTPVPLDHDLAAPSFYLQTHESNMSTARTVAYSVHHVSPTLDVADVQQLANAMANVMAPQATKLPMSTRCAHKLADKAERLLDAVPQLRCDAIPAPLNERLWFL